MTSPRPFGPDELDGVAGLTPDELAAETRLARDLEGIAARDGMRVTPAGTSNGCRPRAARPRSRSVRWPRS